MILFKSCPKCRGDLYLNDDIFGKYLNCIQCGYLKDIPEVMEQPAAGSVREEEVVRKAA